MLTLILSLLILSPVYIIYKYNCISKNKDTFFQKYLVKRSLNSFSEGKRGEFQKQVIKDILSLPKDGWKHNNDSQWVQKGFIIDTFHNNKKYYNSNYTITSFKIYYKDNYIFTTTNLSLFNLFKKLEEVNILNKLQEKYSYKEGGTEDTQEVFDDLKKIKNHTKQIEEIRQKYDAEHKKIYK